MFHVWGPGPDKSRCITLKCLRCGTIEIIVLSRYDRRTQKGRKEYNDELSRIHGRKDCVAYAAL